MRQDVQRSEVAALMEKLPERVARKLRELTDDLRLLVLSHRPMACAMAWRLRDCGVTTDDLRQEGLLGLCEAALRYDESVGSSFAAYASHWCRKMMLLAIERYGCPLRLPDRERRTARFHSLSTEDCARHESADTQADHLPAKPYRQMEDEDQLRTGQTRRIGDALHELTPQEREIIELHYGFGRESLCTTQIAAQMGISKSRASALHLRALRKLEAALRERPLVDYLGPWLELTEAGQNSHTAL